MNTRLDDIDQRLQEPKYEFLYCYDDFLEDKEASVRATPPPLSIYIHDGNLLSDYHKLGNYYAAQTDWQVPPLYYENEYFSNNTLPDPNEE